MGPLAGPYPPAKVLFLFLSGALPAHPHVCLLLEFLTSMGRSLLATWSLSPPRAGPGWWQGWDSLTHFLLQFSGPLAELCQQLLPPLSALRLMFEQQLPHPSPREASSKQIAGGGGIYLGMTGLQSIYSPCSCSLLECQIDSSSSTGGGASPPPFICKEKESLRLIAQLNMQRGKQLFGNYCLCLIMTYRSLTVINFSLELECKCEH